MAGKGKSSDDEEVAVLVEVGGGTVVIHGPDCPKTQAAVEQARRQNGRRGGHWTGVDISALGKKKPKKGPGSTNLVQ
jgi:hypothetical protein